MIPHVLQIRKPGSPSVTLWCNAQGGEIRQEKYSLNDGPEDMCTDFDSDTVSSRPIESFN